jgi:hypothetical protein
VKPKLEAKKKFIKEEPTEDEVKKTNSGNARKTARQKQKIYFCKIS